MRTKRPRLAGRLLFVLVLSSWVVGCDSDEETDSTATDMAFDVAGDLGSGLDADDLGSDAVGGDNQSVPEDIKQAPTPMKLSPEEYTNDPMMVGQSGMGFQLDNIAGAVQIVSDDDRCAIVHGQAQAVVVMDTYKVTDGKEELGIDGVKLITTSQQFDLSQGETVFGNEQALLASSVAVGSCPKVLVEESNTLFEGDYFEEGGCKIPFIADGVTYMAMLGNALTGCAPYEITEGDDLYLFSRYDEESGLAFVIVPVFVKSGEVSSPCIPLDNQSAAAFEAQLEGLL